MNYSIFSERWGVLCLKMVFRIVKWTLPYNSFTPLPYISCWTLYSIFYSTLENVLDNNKKEWILKSTKVLINKYLSIYFWRHTSLSVKLYFCKYLSMISNNLNFYLFLNVICKFQSIILNVNLSYFYVWYWFV